MSAPQTLGAHRAAGFDFFRRAVTELAAAVSEQGFELATEHYDHASFGSAHAELRRKGLNLRLVWNGKEQALFVESSPAALQNWTNIEGSGLVRGHDDARVAALATAIRVRFPLRK